MVFLKNILCVYFVLYICKYGGVAIGQNHLALAFEGLEVVDDFAAEEGAAVFEGGFVDDYFGTFGLDALHHALDGVLAEVVGVRLHRQAVDADDALFFVAGVEVAAVEIVVVRGFAEHLVGDEVLAGAVAIDDGVDKVFGHVGVVGQELLGVLGQAVAAVAEGGVVVVAADAALSSRSSPSGRPMMMREG